MNQGSLARVILAAMALAPSTTAWGGYEVGNGGDVVICQRQNQQETVEILDSFEGKTRTGHTPILHAPSGSAVDLALSALDLFPPSERLRRKEYRAAILSFLDRSAMVDDADLFDVSDTGVLDFLPEACHLRQVAIQRELGLGKRFVIHRPTWDRLAPLDQAGLILHEIIYEEAIRLNHDDSSKVRQFNALLSSGQLAGVSRPTYGRLLESLGFRHANSKELLEFTSHIRLAGRDYEVPQSVMAYSRRVRTDENDRPVLFEVSVLESRLRLPILEDGTIGFQDVAFVGVVELHENGMVKSGLLAGRTVRLLVHGLNEEPEILEIPEDRPSSFAKFDENGLLIRLGTLQFPDGSH